MVDLLLRGCDRISWLLVWLGADYRQLRAILELKLTLDNRRFGRGANKRQGLFVKAFQGGLPTYVIVGLAVGFAPRYLGPFAGTAVVHAFVMVMLGMSLIADFSNVLLDTTDNAVLQPRPITGRTLVIARTIHIVLYLGQMAVGLSLVAMVVGCLVVHPLMPLVYLPTLAMSIVLVVGIVNFLYLSVLRWISGERLRDVVLWFQIGMTIVIVAGSQALGRMVGSNWSRMVNLEEQWWVYLVPPMWMAAPVDLLAGHWHRPQLILTAMGVVIPITFMVLVSRVLAPRFTRSLEALEGSPAGRAEPTHRSAGSWLVSRWVGGVTRSPAAGAAFEFLWVLCSRDRSFKHRTYPMIVVTILMPLPMLITNASKRGEDTAGAIGFLVMLYVAGGLLPMAIGQLRYSPQFAAAWLYEALPLAAPGEIMIGAFLALLLRFLLPGFVLMSAPIVILWGPGMLDDCLLVFSTCLLVASLHALYTAKALPFSEAFVAGQQAGRTGTTMLLMVAAMPMYILHVGLTFLPGAVAIMSVPVLLVAVLIMRRYAATTWSEVSPIQAA